MDTQLQQTQQTPYFLLPEFVDKYKKLGLTAQQVSYITLYERKKVVFEKLQTMELEAQRILLALDARIKEDEELKKEGLVRILTLPEVDKELSAYRKLYNEMVDYRTQVYTNFIREKLIAPAMNFEKNIDPEENPKYKELNGKFLALREYETQRKARITEHAVEKQRYIAHINNDSNSRIAQYNKDVLNEIEKMYSFFLETKEEKPDLKTLKEAIKTIQLKKPTIFTRTLVTDEERIEIGKMLQAENKLPDLARLQQVALELVDLKFQTYGNDLSQVKKDPDIILQVKQNAKAEIDEIETTLQQEIAVENLVASATVIPEIMPTVKPVEEYYTVPVKNYETFEGMINLVVCFIKMKDPLKYITKVKDNYGNFSVERMANALAKYANDKERGELFKTLVYEKVKK